MDRSYKFLFTGPPGVGKTTAIAAISDIEPVTTEMKSSGELANIKEMTTTALDFGELKLQGGDVVRLYGTPGQRRFQFMWELLLEGALGVVILIDNMREDPLGDLDIYVENFSGLIAETGAVVGLTRSDVKPEPGIDAFYERLQTHNVMLPVLECDIRRRDDVSLLLDALISTIEN